MVSAAAARVCCCPRLVLPQVELCQAAVEAGVPRNLVYGDSSRHELPRLIHYMMVRTLYSSMTWCVIYFPQGKTLLAASFACSSYDFKYFGVPGFRGGSGLGAEPTQHSAAVQRRCWSLGRALHLQPPQHGLNTHQLRNSCCTSTRPWSLCSCLHCAVPCRAVLCRAVQVHRPKFGVPMAFASGIPTTPGELVARIKELQRLEGQVPGLDFTRIYQTQ